MSSNVFAKDENANEGSNRANFESRRLTYPKNKLNIVSRGYIETEKDPKTGEEYDLIAIRPDVPVSAYLNDLCFLVTIPNQDQTYAPAYVRLQEKTGEEEQQDEVRSFTGVSCKALVKKSRNTDGEIIVCAPRTRVLVQLNRLVIQAEIPLEDELETMVHFKPRASRPRVQRRANGVGYTAQPIREEGNADAGHYDVPEQGGVVKS